MPTVVGVKLRFSSKVLSFDPADTAPEQGDRVIVETERGSEFGEVAVAPHDVDASDLVAPLKPVLRVASADDIAHAEDLQAQERDAMPIYRELINKHKLDMKPIDVEYLFDGSKMIFYFSAEERVDFRELVRDLAARFKARIDMRQVGVRDEARMVGGIGHCGQPLCCVRFPGDFQPVSIRMAKEQDLPLNPLKISGLCGRLMCCLRYEYDAYKDFKGRAPKRKAIIDTPLGLGKVIDLNTPLETVSVRLEDGQRFTVPLCSMECGKDGGRPCAITQEALEESGAVMPAAPALTESPSKSQPRSKRGRSEASKGGGKGPSDGSSGKKSGGGQRSEGKKTESKKSGGRRSGRKRSGSKQSGTSQSSGSGSSAKNDGAKKSTSQGATDASAQREGSGSTGRRRRRRRTPREGSPDNGKDAGAK